MNKYLYALLFGFGALITSLIPSIEGHSLSLVAIIGALGTALVAGLAKLMDPYSIIALPPWATAVILAVGVVLPTITNAVSAGTIMQPAVIIGIVGTFLMTLYAKWSMPTGFKLAHRRL